MMYLGLWMLYFLVMEQSTQVWNRNPSWVWTRDLGEFGLVTLRGECARNLHTAPDRWLSARTRSRVEASCELLRARL